MRSMIARQRHVAETYDGRRTSISRLVRLLNDVDVRRTLVYGLLSMIGVNLVVDAHPSAKNRRLSQILCENFADSRRDFPVISAYTQCV